MAALLTVDTAPAYVASLADVVRAFPDGAELAAEEIHGGNLNYAFRVRDASGKSVFLKQAPEFIKVFGPEAKLHRERMELEVRAYREWECALGVDVAARWLPRLLHVDLDAMAFVMQDLCGYELLDRELFAGEASEQVAASLGEFMGLSHARTHCTLVPEARAAELTAAFANEQLRDIQLEYVFSKAFREAPQAESLRSDAEFLAQLDTLKALYRGEEKGNLSLCHGDLHPGSVMVDVSTSDVKVIDPEFAVFGPPGLDAGSLLSGYVLAYVAHACRGDVDTMAGVKRCIEQIWRSYSAALQAGGVASVLVERTSADAIGFAACEVARTALGFAGVRSLPVEDVQVKKVAEQAALDMARRCIVGPRDRGMDLLLEEMDKLAAVVREAKG